MRSIGPMELLVILAMVVLLFGGKKIPEVAKNLRDSLGGGPGGPTAA
jgi:TatA/E family protein of Tat protein translocase